MGCDYSNRGCTYNWLECGCTSSDVQSCSFDPVLKQNLPPDRLCGSLPTLKNKSRRAARTLDVSSVFKILLLSFFLSPLNMLRGEKKCRFPPPDPPPKWYSRQGSNSAWVSLFVRSMKVDALLPSFINLKLFSFVKLTL
jgi:hypothetical protein